MPDIYLRLLGPPVARSAGLSVRLERKQLGLLAYLAVTGRPAGRACLSGLLWPDAAAGQAQTNLRKAVWAVKAVAGSEALTVEPAAGTVRLGPTVRSDVASFEHLLATARPHAHEGLPPCADCTGHLHEAVALYRGEFLAGFGLRDSPDFDDWQLLQADRLRQAYALALDQLAAAREDAGHVAEALSLAQQRLALDPLHEPAHRQVMALLAGLGQRAEALRQFERCRAMLRGQLGAEVDPATMALQRTILAGSAVEPGGRGAR